MPQKQPSKSEGVQVCLDPELKQEAKVYLAMTGLTWQELLEERVREFVQRARAEYGELSLRERAKP